jgi:hypothetical protein
MIFCTLFNKAHLPQGIVPYRSLEHTAKGGFGKVESTSFA